MGCLRNVIETKRKISTMIKEQENEKYTNLTCGFFFMRLDWGKLHNQRLQKLIRIRKKKRNIHVSQRL